MSYDTKVSSSSRFLTPATSSLRFAGKLSSSKVSGFARKFVIFAFIALSQYRTLRAGTITDTEGCLQLEVTSVTSMMIST